MNVASIRSLLRILIDSPNTAIWSNNNLNTLIFSEYRDICNAIAERFPNYFMTTGTVATVAGTAYTALPSSCTYPSKLVNSSGETIRYVPLSQFDHTSSNSEPTGFCVNGRNIWWNPTPDAVYSYTIYYNAMPTDLSADGDTPSLPPNFHDILAYGVAVNARLAKDEQIRDYQFQYGRKMEMLLHQISVEQTNNAPRVLRVYDASEQ